MTKDFKRSLWTMIAFAVLTIGIAFTPGAKLIIVLLPLGGALVALTLLSKPQLYTNFVLWLFALTPFIRRVVEWRGSGPTPATQLIMTAPLLAAIAGLAVWRKDWQALGRAYPTPWIFATMGLAYATIVGLLLHHVRPILPDLISWTAPVCFALYLLAQRQQRVQLLNSLRDGMMWATLLTSLYGLYQYLFTTPWDVAWMESSNLTSVGSPEPMEIRVFSTLNTPQPFADFLVFGLLMCLTSHRRLRFFVAPLALLNILLTNSRSSWVAAAVSLAYVSLTLTSRQRMQLIAIGLACIGLISIATLIPEFNESLTKRIDTFKDLKNDGSAADRLESQKEAIAIFTSTPFGLGFGVEAGLRPPIPSRGQAHYNYVTTGDNGLEELGLTMGWFGSAIYLFGFGGCIMALLRLRASQAIVLPRAMIIALLIQVPFLGIFPGLSGFLLWTCIGLGHIEGLGQAEENQQASTAALPWIRSAPQLG